MFSVSFAPAVLRTAFTHYIFLATTSVTFQKKSSKQSVRYIAHTQFAFTSKLADSIVQKRCTRAKQRENTFLFLAKIKLQETLFVAVAVSTPFACPLVLDAQCIVQWRLLWELSLFMKIVSSRSGLLATALVSKAALLSCLGRSHTRQTWHALSLWRRKKSRKKNLRHITNKHFYLQ